MRTNHALLAIYLIAALVAVLTVAPVLAQALADVNDAGAAL